MSKTRKCAKKLLSILLCLSMLLPALSMFDFSSIVASAAINKQSQTPAIDTNINFVVPETIYLQPNTSMIDFQYYFNNTENGTAEAGYSSTGKYYISFTDSSIVSFTLSVSGVSTISSDLGDLAAGITVYDNSASGTISSGKLSDSLSANQTTLLEWTLKATTNSGATLTYKNYTVAYAPYINTAVAGAQTYAQLTRQGVTVGVYGINAIESNYSLGAFYLGNSSIDTENNADGGSGASGSFTKNPIINHSYTPSNWQGNTPGDYSANGTGFSYYYRESENDTNFAGSTGLIYIDSSRQTQAKHVPNLGVFMDRNGLNKKDHRSWTNDSTTGRYYIINNIPSASNSVVKTSSEYSNTAYSTNNVSAKHYDALLSNDSTGIANNYTIVAYGKSSGRWKADAFIYTEDHTRTAQAYAFATFKSCDKSNLRAKIREAINGSYAQEYYTAESYAAYLNSIKQACTEIGTPSCTQISTSSSVYTNITSGVNGLVFGTGTANAVHKCSSITLGTDPAVNYNYGDTITASANTYTGYTYSSFSGEDALSVKYVTKPSISWTLNYTANTYQINYNLNGGSTNASLPASATYDTIVSVNTPEKTGYIFNGWKVSGYNSNTAKWGTTTSPSTNITDSSLCINGKNTVYFKNLTATQDATVTLTAVWTPISYTISFNGNGNTNTANMSDIAMVYDTAKTLTANAFEKTGYYFNSWNTKADGSGATYTDQANVNNLTDKNETVTLFAQWSKNPYNVFFHGNGGSYNNSDTYSQPFVYDEPHALNANQFANAYTITFIDQGVSSKTDVPCSFSKWNTKADGSGTSYNNNQSVSNLTVQKDGRFDLYAQWASATTSAPSLYKDGYIFKGWSTIENGPVVYTAEDTITVTTNITLYAVYIDITPAENKITTDKASEIASTNTREIIEGAQLSADNKFVDFISSYDNIYNSTQWQSYVNAYNNYLQKKAAYKASPNKSTANAFESAFNAWNTAVIPTENTTNISKVDLFKIVYTDNTDHYFKNNHNYSVNDMNLNHYSIETLQHIDSKYYTLKNNINTYTQSELNTQLKAVIKDFVAIEDISTANPEYKVYETTQAIKSLLNQSDVEAVNYVYTGKSNYTYYCYVNSTNPTLVIDLNQNNTGRVAYPLLSNVQSQIRTPVYDEAGNIINTVTTELNELETLQHNFLNESVVTDVNSLYSNFLAHGIGNAPTCSIGNTSLQGETYYNSKTRLILTPNFDIDRQAVVYTIKTSDDSLSKNYANTSTLYGTNQTINTATADETVTPTDTITIFVSYHHTPYVGSRISCYMDQIPLDKYLNQYHLFRTSGGASNWELTSPNDSVYSVYDPTFNTQSKWASFTYTFLPQPTGAMSEAAIVSNGRASDNGYIPSEEFIKIIQNNYNNYPTFTKYNKDVEGSGLGKQNWGNSGSSWSYNYYPDLNSYTYVHLIDRWGNTFDRIFSVANYDPAAPVITSSTGSAEIQEIGRSGINSITVSNAQLTFLSPLSTESNEIIVDTGVANKTYTVNVTDKAENKVSSTVTSDSDGVIKFTVQDDDYVATTAGYKITVNNTAIELFSNIQEDFKFDKNLCVNDKENIICGFPLNYQTGDLMEYGLTLPTNLCIRTSGKDGDTTFRTGTTIDIINKDTGDTVKTYNVIIFGDVNKDGVYDGQDAVLVNSIISNMLTQESLGDAAFTAADCNHDGVIDQNDVELLNQAGILLTQIPQKLDNPELTSLSVFQEYSQLITQTVSELTIPSADKDTNIESPDDTDSPSDSDNTQPTLVTMIVRIVVQIVKTIVKFFIHR